MCSKPLVVDLDGTLIRSDILSRCGFAFLKSCTAPFLRAACVARAWRQSRRSKRGSRRRPISTSPCCLTTPAHRMAAARSAPRVARSCSRPRATSATPRRSPSISASSTAFRDQRERQSVRASQARYAGRGVRRERLRLRGNSHDDVPVWASRRPRVCRQSARMAWSAQRASKATSSACSRRAAASKVWAKSLRLHQWLKNLLIFVPLLAGTSSVGSLAARAARAARLSHVRHVRVERLSAQRPARPRRRPASSRQTRAPARLRRVAAHVGHGAFSCAARRWRSPSRGSSCLGSSRGAARLLRPDARLFDVAQAPRDGRRGRARRRSIRCASSPARRAIGAHLTFWLLAFSMFIFLSLAFVKRYAELHAMHGARPREDARTRLRGERPAADLVARRRLRLSRRAGARALHPGPATPRACTGIRSSSGSPARCCSTGSAARGSSRIAAACTTIRSSSPRRTAAAWLVVALCGLRLLAGDLTDGRSRSPGAATRRAAERASDRLARHARRALARCAAAHGTTLAFGNGRSYGDSCLAASGHVCRRCRSTGSSRSTGETGVLRAEPGITLEQILARRDPARLVAAGHAGHASTRRSAARSPTTCTARTITCAAPSATMCARFGLLRSDGSQFECSPTCNAAFFAATIGGLGLTGLITWAEIQLMPIRSSLHRRDEHPLSRTSTSSSRCREQLDAQHEYSVAWVDCLSRGAALGRGIFMVGDHAQHGPLEVDRRKKRTVPCHAARSR